MGVKSASGMLLQSVNVHFDCRWLVGVSYRVITFKDPVPSLDKGKRAISQLAAVPGAIYLSRGSMTAEAPSKPAQHVHAQLNFPVKSLLNVLSSSWLPLMMTHCCGSEVPVC